MNERETQPYVNHFDLHTVKTFFKLKIKTVSVQ